MGAMPMTYVFTRGAMGEAASVTRVVAGTARQWVEKLRGGQGGVRGWGEGGGGSKVVCGARGAGPGAAAGGVRLARVRSCSVSLQGGSGTIV